MFQREQLRSGAVTGIVKGGKQSWNASLLIAFVKIFQEQKFGKSRNWFSHFLAKTDWQSNKNFYTYVGILSFVLKQMSSAFIVRVCGHFDVFFADKNSRLLHSTIQDAGLFWSGFCPNSGLIEKKTSAPATRDQSNLGNRTSKRRAIWLALESRSKSKSWLFLIESGTFRNSWGNFIKYTICHRKWHELKSVQKRSNLYLPL